MSVGQLEREQTAEQTAAGQASRRPPARGLRRFAQQYGWRAYALPVLLVVTVIALMTSGRPGQRPAGRATPAGTAASAPVGGAAATPSATDGPAGPAGSAAQEAQAAPPVATGSTNLKTDTPTPGAAQEALASDALPAGAPYTEQGTGSFAVLPGTGPVVGSGTVHRYSIEVENGVTGVDTAAFAKDVDTVLADPRSWTGHGSGIALQRVDSGQIDFRISLTSAFTVRSLCGYDQKIETSCYDAGQSRVVLNVARWVRGDAAYVGNVELYRTYMINHEDGHALGHEHSHECLAGGLAPVMMQQTIGLKSVTGQMCQANAWPYPPGAADAPGREEPDTAANDESVLIGSH